jgi:GxxExxY protein
MSYRLGREELDRISSTILKSAIKVHSKMGPGLLEGVYEECMVLELRSNGLEVRQQVPVTLYYNEVQIKRNLIVDILIEDEIILELKSVESLIKIHEAQLLTYLRLSNKRLGFLINFNVPLIKEGFKRLVNNF